MFTYIPLALLAFAPNVLSAPQGFPSVAAGQVITTCTVPGTVALTFDDGPSQFTSQLLDILKEFGAKATFFVLGEAAGSFPQMIQRARGDGHQIGSHTFTHPSLPTLSSEEVIQQLTRVEETLRPIMGDAPTYMRPPYLEVNDQVLTTMGSLGYKVIHSSVDTKDYENNEATRIGLSFDKFVAELNAGGNLVLAHDIHEQTVVTLARKMLEEVKGRGLKAVTVGECLGETEAEWYRR